MKFSLATLFFVLTALAVSFALLRYWYVSENPFIPAVAIVLFVTSLAMIAIRPR